MPQWAGSCWYYLRFCDPHNDQEAWSSEAEKYWMPVDLYVGGVEHAVLHLLYARFWHKVLYDCGLVHTPEPFQTLRNQGLVTARSYQDAARRLSPPEEVVEKEGLIIQIGTNEELDRPDRKRCRNRNSTAYLPMRSSKSLEPMRFASTRCSWGRLIGKKSGTPMPSWLQTLFKPLLRHGLF